MKNAGPEVAHLSPSAHGWWLRYEGSVRDLPTLAEVAATLPAKAQLHLALPCQMALLERLTFPATSQEELEGMAQLQLEKTLPYPVEEAASDLEVIHQAENESTVLSIAVHTESLARLCEPLRARQRIPAKITLFALHFAAACPPNEVVLGIWNEQEHLIVGIFDDTKLNWAQTILLSDADTLTQDLPGLILGAEMEGIPTNFSRIVLDRECAKYSPDLRESFRLPIEIIDTDQPLPEPSANLLPSSWAEETARAERGERFRQNLILAAMIYLMAIAGAFVYLAIMKHRVQHLDAQIAGIQPQVLALETIKHRWSTLAPAIDPSRSAEELLYQVNKCRPNENVQLTQFEITATGFKIEAEATEAMLMIAFQDKLHNAEGLKGFKITSSAVQYIKTKEGTGKNQISIFFNAI